MPRTRGSELWDPQSSLEGGGLCHEGPHPLVPDPLGFFTQCLGGARPFLERGARTEGWLRGQVLPAPLASCPPCLTHQSGFSAAALGLNLMSLFTLKRTSSSVSGGMAIW